MLSFKKIFLATIGAFMIGATTMSATTQNTSTSNTSNADTTVTFTAGTDKTSSSSATSIKKSNVTLTGRAGAFYYSPYSIGNTKQFKVSSSSYYFKKIKLSTQYTFAASTGNYDTSTKTWTPTNVKELVDEVTFTCNGSTSSTVVSVTVTCNYASSVNFDSRGSGSGTISCVASDGTTINTGDFVLLGTSLTFTATTNPTTMHFVKWEQDGTEYSDNPLTIVNNDGVVNIYAWFETNTYTIRFLNYDGTVLESQSVTHWGTPTYSGSTPTKPADAQYTYTFSGWSPTIGQATQDQDYTAQFSSTVNKYTITFKDDDGTVLQSSEWEYGTTPTYSGTTPTKASTTQYSYTFNGWDKTIATVTEAATYTATYSQTTNQYTITFKNYDNTVLQESKWDYGSTPSYSGTPTKPSTVQTDYTFSGWSPSIATVTGDATYTAQYSESVRQYTITFKDDDGTTLQSSKWNYGTTPTCAEPTKAATKQYTYTFKEWNPSISSVTCDTTYTAVYNATVNKYKVTYLNYDDSELQSSDWDYGSTPSYVGATPTKPSTAEHSYTFSGWSPNETMVTEAATYKAQFTEGVRKYNITFKNYDGSILESKECEVNTTPTYTGSTPTKPSSTEQVFEFTGWSPEITTVTGDATYIAQFTGSTRKYNITFKNYDGTTLITSEWDYGVTPSYSGTPTRNPDAQYTYTFAGWSPAIVAVGGDATYTATYTTTVNTYNIVFKNYDNTILQDSKWDYGAMPKYNGDTPTKPADAQFTYTFKGWDKDIVSVTGDATYVAQFEAHTNQYTVTFKNYDGSIIQTSKYDYGAIPSCSTTPTKPADAQYTYTFSGWSPSITTVTGDKEYVAQFSNTTNQYTVTFKNYDGTELQKDTLDYGATPEYKGAEPTKPADAQYTYTFSGWSPSITTVTGNATYTAQFDKTVNKYTVTFKNYDGSTLQEETLDYGAMPEYKGTTPTKPSTESKSYTFSGWSPEITSVEGNQEYTAQFNEGPRKYTITFKNDDGTLLRQDDFEVGTTPEYKGTTPTKASTAQYSYTFKGWDKTIAPVTGDATYTATYNEVTRTYSVTYKNYDGTELQKDTLTYGSDIPPYKGEEPTKPSTAEFSYKFSGWASETNEGTITGNIVYVAQFTSETNKYNVSFNVGDHGSPISSIKVEYGKTIATPAEPVATGFVFEGWYKDAEFNTKWNFDTDKVEGDVTLYAKWSVAPTKKSNLTWIIAGASIGGAALIGTGTYFLIRKKRIAK